MKSAVQYAALPFIESKNGTQILLVTSRETRRWVLPKGWPEKGVTPRKQALIEAYEEAGVGGTVCKKEIGSYTYLKCLANGTQIKCNVSVFPLRVTYQNVDWPEKEQRDLIWLSPKEAARRVDEKTLSKILESFDPNTFDQ